MGGILSVDDDGHRGVPVLPGRPFRAAGASYRAAQAGHLSLAQLKVMSAGAVQGADRTPIVTLRQKSSKSRKSSR
jgi:hypothetical protein